MIAKIENQTSDKAVTFKFTGKKTAREMRLLKNKKKKKKKK